MSGGQSNQLPKRRGVGTKNHVASKSAKIAIRRNVLEAVGRDAHVFDAFAGAGEMHREVWHDAAGYVGCDKIWYRDGRVAFAADNRRVMRSIDLTEFRIFDFDSFGSPWEQTVILAARRPVAPNERVGVVLTEGSGLKIKAGELPHALAVLTGLQPRLAGLFRWQADITDRAVNGLAGRLGCRIAKRWDALGKTGAAVRYIGLVLIGQAQEVLSDGERSARDAREN
jgi:hypothetical protein